ncbi:polyadenylate-binding protein, cytoplasmic and nuclear-like [Arachis ipaensis]|uniref:polyadenylate-binding protein, cytoplasmic and nuclear-like n=1 Tax=Arachis ipaensis TaxID=130454 RepID=UPI0007AF7CAF|nr:polyadenylate-binding protein, cytoplasmic and nuclear-like [Arachis ipaensis]
MSNVRWDKIRQSHVEKDPQIWNWEANLRLENESFTIFVDNLPGNVSKNELFHMFKWTGRINDIYLARKEKYGRIHLFAFIRYTTKGGALKAIKEMNGMRLQSKEIFVGEAKYRRRIDVRKKTTTHDEDVRHLLMENKKKLKKRILR